MASGANRGVAAMHFLGREFGLEGSNRRVDLDRAYLRASFRSSDVIP